MEQPNQRTMGRSLGRPAPATQGRPLSADDIQKAKMRAQFMQSKYGKANNDDTSRLKPQAPNGITSPPDGILHGAPKLQDRPKVEECEKLRSFPSIGSNQLENHLKLSSDTEEPPPKRCKRMQIPWRKPPGKFAVVAETPFLLICRFQKRRNNSFFTQLKRWNISLSLNILLPSSHFSCQDKILHNPSEEFNKLCNLTNITLLKWLVFLENCCNRVFHI